MLAAEDNDGDAIALAVGGGLEPPEVALQVDRPAEHAGGRRFLDEDSAERRLARARAPEDHLPKREELQGQGSLDADLEAHCTTASRTSTPTSPTTPETRAAGHGRPRRPAARARPTGSRRSRRASRASRRRRPAPCPRCTRLCSAHPRQTATRPGDRRPYSGRTAT